MLAAQEGEGSKGEIDPGIQPSFLSLPHASSSPFVPVPLFSFSYSCFLFLSAKLFKPG